MHCDVEHFSASPADTLQTVLERLNASGRGIVLVMDEQRRLLGTITDGDIRRALLAKLELTARVALLLERKGGTRYSKPLTAVIGQSRQHYLQLLIQHSLSHLPLLNEKQEVVGLVAMEDFLEEKPSFQAVVMAGGKGTRLYPLTESLPKPMLPVGDKPLLEIIIEQLRHAGVGQVNITTHHKAEKITGHFGNGQNFGVDLSYVAEDRPLGTAGALGLLEKPKGPLLVINGDVLTRVDFKAMIQFHKEHMADLTVAVRSYDLKVPYGVVECEGASVTALKEKPNYSFLVNAGIYLLEPHVHQYIPQGEHYNMTDLIQNLLDLGRNVVSFPVHEYWLDIGEHLDYQLAQEEVMRFKQT